MIDKTKLSVIVCTYNRANLLKEALESLVHQTLDKTLYEIIVVDNASLDNTVQVVQDFQKKHYEVNIRLIHEINPGLSIARNTGIRHAQGIYVAFIDDDAIADRDWLKTALHCFEEINPPPIGIGGPILPFYNSPKPAWFKDEYETRTWGDNPRFLKPGESFSGSNMILRKKTLNEYGGFDTRVGIKGKHLLLGEETALFERLWKSKKDKAFLYYSPKLLVYHLVPHYKMTLSYRLKRAFTHGQSWYLWKNNKHIIKRFLVLIGSLVSIIRFSTLAVLHYRRYQFYQNWIIEKISPISAEIGKITGCLGIYIPIKQE